MSKALGIIKEMGFIKNEKGQMAIFIALFFQVLFVFFAMAINMGLVVHDKINLQNSVDLAAYYGAMKQGEVLNQISHINYQMRQNYKLFVWRYRVLGTLGNRNHPLSYIRYLSGGSPTLLPEAQSWSGSSPPAPTDIVPSVCISHSFFQETKDLDQEAASVCRDNNVSIPPIPAVSAATGFVPGAGNLGPTFDFLRDQIAKFCKEAGLMNWRYSARILSHFRADGFVRKNMINTLAGNLTRADPLDLRNESIEEGVRKTFERNLTDTNRGGVQDFQYFNSLGTGGCAQVSNWLVQIKINPVIMYHDWDSNTDTGACPAAELKPNRGSNIMPFAFSDPNGNFQADRANTTTLQDHWRGEPTDDMWHSSVGYEKNPWCMVYTGVRATTAIRKPFDPTGAGVTLEARGFAKPFGGRIGPWYGNTWPQGAANSMASNRSQMVDPLLPSRDAPSAGASPPEEDVANHTRYPGDEFGMSSMSALSAMAPNFMSVMAHNDRSDPSPVALANYAHLNGVNELFSTGDSLARTGTTGYGVTVEPKQRIFELAAVAPDVFDALYFSVEPRYFTNYFSTNTTNGGAQLPDAQRIFDFGATKDSYSDSYFPTTSNQYSVLQQVEWGRDQAYEAGYLHILRDWKNLLTSWHQKGAVDYTMDEDRFGKCDIDVDTNSNPSLPTTGNCIQGGRTGYSVKNISRDYLMSSDHAVGGGATGAAGPILNPPNF